MKKRTVFVVLTLLASFFVGCGGEKESTEAADEAAEALANALNKSLKIEEETPKPAETDEPAKAPSAVTADKEMFGLDLKPFGKWKPVWDSDIKVAKWENDDLFFGVIIRLVEDKLDSMDDLKKAAGMMMQLGSSITEVIEEKKTDKGWYAVVKRDSTTDFVYIQKHDGTQIVCSANITESKNMGSIKKADAIKACDSIQIKK